MKSPNPIIALILLLTACRHSAPAESSGELLLDNDAYPFLTEHEGTYYMTIQNPSVDSIILRKAPTVASLAGSRNHFLWNDPGMRNIYSPELHRIDGKWYVYFEADNGQNTDTHQLYVIENPADDPTTGQWTLHGPIITNPDWNFGLHPTTFEADGRRYLLWSGWPTRRTETETQCIYIAEMENPWTLKSERVMISRPEYEWERQWINPDGSRTTYPIYVNENPEAFLSPDGKTVVVAYSASGIWTDYSTLGILHASTASDLLDPASWQKEPEPFFRPTSKTPGAPVIPGSPEAELFGVSNISMVKDPEAPGYYLLYQTKHKNPELGMNINSIRWKHIDWPDDSIPRFGRP